MAIYIVYLVKLIDISLAWPHIKFSKVWHVFSLQVVEKRKPVSLEDDCSC